MTTSITTSLVLAALLAALAGLTGAVVTYLVARRHSSGTVSTSDAATLWEASNAIRREMREEIKELRRQVDEQRRQIEEWRAKFLLLQAEVDNLRRQGDER